MCLFNSHLFSTAPFADAYTFAGPSGAFRGSSGNTYVVDAKKDILILNENMEYVRTISGGSTQEGSFYYATAVTDGPEGIYVADALYSGEGTTIQAERILRFERDGSGGEVLFQLEYPAAGVPPKQYGRIKFLTLEGDKLIFTTAEGHAASVYTHDLTTGETEQEFYLFGDSHVFTSTLDPATGRPIIIAGDGTIQTIDDQGQPVALMNVSAFPYQLTATEDGRVLYSELNSGALMRTDEKGRGRVVTDEVYAYYVSSHQDTVILSDGVGVAIYENEVMDYETEAPIANATTRNLMWCLLFLCAVGLLALLLLGARALVRSWTSHPFFRKIALVLVIAVAASAGVSWYLLSTAFREEDERNMAQLEAISDAIVAQTDVALLRGINNSADYRNEAFNQQKARLDAVIDAGYERGEYYYYLTYMTDGFYIYNIMDYEDTVRTWMQMYNYGVEGYTEIFETGEPLLVEGEVSTWGAWTLLAKPVYDENGAIIAVQEIGFNADSQYAARRELIIDTILTILFGAIVLVMLIIEGIYFWEHRRKKRELLARFDAAYDQTDLVPLRTLIFLAFTVDCMQDAFISILATRLYEPIWGIPQSVGAALPISGQVLMAAIFAVLGGFLASRFGAKRVICMGFLVQAAGFLLCGLLLSYAGILLGKLLVGAGVGLISVGVNTTAAEAADPGKSVETFAGITAGILVGASAGSGLGSIILSLGGYRVVFFAGTVILLGGLLLTLSGKESITARTTLPSADGEEPAAPEKGASIGLGAFLLGKGGALPFLAMMLAPSMAALSFKDYFFPIYAAENGMSETNIGRVYVICGLLVIYAGPVITRYLTERLGNLRTAVFMCGLAALANVSFGLVPTMVGAVLGVVLMVVSFSCGSTAQSSYYASLPAASAYGEGRAMGVYSLFDNGGQTLGPILYGALMLLGYQTGMLYAGGALILLTAAFSAVKHKDLKAARAILREEPIC